VFDILVVLSTRKHEMIFENWAKMSIQKSG